MTTKQTVERDLRIMLGWHDYMSLRPNEIGTLCSNHKTNLAKQLLSIFNINPKYILGESPSQSGMLFVNRRHLYDQITTYKNGEMMQDRWLEILK